MENLINQEPELKNLTLDPAGISHLKETRTWTMFLSILGFVFLGIMLIFGLVGSSLTANMAPYGAMSSGVLLFFMIIMMIIYFFPIYFLFNFSRFSKQAIESSDAVAFTESIRYLKLHYRYMGILAIIVLSIYLLIFIIALMAGSLSGLFNT